MGTINVRANNCIGGRQAISTTKKYEDLRFNDDFMFGRVISEYPDICKELLEVILDTKIEAIYPETQKSITATVDGKDIRLDAYVVDDESKVYDVEMQNHSGADTRREPELPKRSRYYQGMIDLAILNGGQRYQSLKTSYIIFICTYDPFGAGLKRYTFKNLCLEDPAISLDDQSVKIFLNTKGTRSGRIEISEELQHFLDYMNTGETGNSFTRRLDEAVESVRENKNWRHEYMKKLIVMQEKFDEGIEQGQRFMLFGLVNDGLITLETAANRLGLDEASF